MDSNNNTPSFLKLIEDDDPIFWAIGPSTLYLSVFKTCVFDNSFIAKIIADDGFINFKGGSVTLYVGDRFWNVKMEGWSDKSAFTNGWSKLIEDLALDT
ncbi:hypothetical protein Hanom_Chr03g00250861 [Helianthus anomalus]